MKNLVVLTGAGMSAESGISTFRDAGGLWDQYPVEQVSWHFRYPRPFPIATISCPFPFSAITMLLLMTRFTVKFFSNIALLICTSLLNTKKANSK